MIRDDLNLSDTGFSSKLITNFWYSSKSSAVRQTNVASSFEILSLGSVSTTSFFHCGSCWYSTSRIIRYLLAKYCLTYAVPVSVFQLARALSMGSDADFLDFLDFRLLDFREVFIFQPPPSCFHSSPSCLSESKSSEIKSESGSVLERFIRFFFNSGSSAGVIISARL